MKESKLDPHREFIVKKLQARTPINRICKDLAKQGCPVSRSYLTEWIAAVGINYMPCKRGRPVGARLFSLLPAAGEDPQSACAPLFLFGLQEGVSEDKNIGLCKMTLSMLLLPSASAHPDQWKDLDRYADLSDLELLLLAYLRSDLGAPPFAQGRQPMNDWYWKLATLAMELKEAIAAAIKSHKS
jgi:hypothetical protein